MHTPIKIGSKSMRRRTSSHQITPNSTPPYGTSPKESIASPVSTSDQPSAPTHTPVPSIKSPNVDSDTGPLSSFTLAEESDTAANSSESECVLSEPCGYRSPNEFSPERKVQFINSETRDTFDVDGLKDKKKRWVTRERSKDFVYFVFKGGTFSFVAIITPWQNFNIGHLVSNTC